MRALLLLTAALCILPVHASAAPLLAAGSTPPAGRSTPSVITLVVSKAEIHIAADFHGDLLKVTGVAPRDCEVILRLSSPPVEETLDLKGKRGHLWMTVGKVRFQSAPLIYMLRSTRPIGEILSPGEQVRESLGVVGLKASLRVQPGVDAGLFASELLRLRSDDGFYNTDGGGVTRGGDGIYGAEFRWPVRGPSGTYRMDAFAARRGVIIGVSSQLILVYKIGAGAWISDLATSHGLVYGLLAVLVALLTGLAAGAFFGRLGRAK